MPADLAVLALLLAGYALVAARLDRYSIGPAMAFVAIGLVVSDKALGLVSYLPEAEVVRLLAEGALTLLLFSDASGIRSRALERDIGPIVRLLAIGLPLTIALGTVSAALLFPGISFGVALLIGSALAPTDAALGQPVVSNPVVPSRVRRLLSVESGLNDGIATPFVFLGLGLAATEATGHDAWLTDAVVASAVGAVVGVVLGFVGGKLLDGSLARGWASGASSQLFVLALAAGSYLTAAAMGGNGFIAAFVAGLAFGSGSRHHDERAVRFTETQGTLLAIGVWAAFGLVIAGELAPTFWNVNAILFAVLSLTVMRLIPVALALLGIGFRPPTMLFIGWFGPRGLASIVFLVIGLEGLGAGGIDAAPVVSAVSWTVLLSVILHGLSAGPLARAYGRFTRTLSSGAPESGQVPELESGRLGWARGVHR